VRLPHGCFSFLPDLTDEQIEKQIAYSIARGLAMNVVGMIKKRSQNYEAG